ncbi:MAG TPA: cytidine deaminase [Bacillota bacterium]|nr:cytidine deaminase [Bacillota bacterium]
MKVDAKALLDQARRAAARAYAPYSRFPVGAALLTASGRTVTGCNVENASYGLSICAERAAVFAAVAAGGAERLQAVAIFSPEARPCPPCGACRQVLAEFGDDEMAVILEGEDGRPEATTLGALLPRAFRHA